MNNITDLNRYKDARMAKCLELEEEILKIKAEEPEVVNIQLTRNSSGLISIKSIDKSKSRLAVEILTQFFKELEEDIL